MGVTGRDPGDSRALCPSSWAPPARPPVRQPQSTRCGDLGSSQCGGLRMVPSKMEKKQPRKTGHRGYRGILGEASPSTWHVLGTRTLGRLPSSPDPFVQPPAITPSFSHPMAHLGRHHSPSALGTAQGCSTHHWSAQLGPRASSPSAPLWLYQTLHLGPLPGHFLPLCLCPGARGTKGRCPDQTIWRPLDSLVIPQPHSCERESQCPELLPELPAPQPLGGRIPPPFTPALRHHPVPGWDPHTQTLGRFRG